MNETRNLTAEEWAEFAGVFEKAGVYSPDSVRRFVDTRLNKIYDVFLLDGKLVLKKSDRDKEKFENYFAGHGFSVPLVVSSFRHGDDCWVTMPYIDGTDARDCSPEDAEKVGRELAKIQSYYLGTGTNPDGCKSYFDRKVLRFWEKSRKYFPEYSDIFGAIEARFFSAPRTLIHDDFLPINALLDGENAWLIDWTYADILPYFLDLGRFAFVGYEDGKPYISTDSAKAFLEAYYEEMRRNPRFTVNRQEFSRDTAISAFCQYSMFVYFEEEEKVKESEDYRMLGEILGYLDKEFKSTKKSS
ncbi:MAG: aminoglycoside phosphotransferase family protein [Oscillospiraceae bacterium]|nr:aminoglycoside phosphotransferase family protein [Oscillospiraceae bacterium]